MKAYVGSILFVVAMGVTLSYVAVLLNQFNHDLALSMFNVPAQVVAVK